MARVANYSPVVGVPANNADILFDCQHRTTRLLPVSRVHEIDGTQDADEHDLEIHYPFVLWVAVTRCCLSIQLFASSGAAAARINTIC